MRPRFNTTMRQAKSFNPRTRKGCDDIYYYAIEAKISFNPRTRKGCDLLCRKTLR